MTGGPPVLVVVEDSWTVGETDEHEDMWAVAQLDRLAEELAAGGSVSPHVVTLSRLVSHPAAQDARTLFIVFGELSMAAVLADRIHAPVPVLERRTFALGVHRGAEPIRTLERTGGPGCVETPRLYVWQSEPPDEDPGDGVFARKDVALSIGAQWDSPALWESEHYAMIRHEEHPTMARLLGAYLAAYGDTPQS